jgi:CRP-like cAMP-binding protein
MTEPIKAQEVFEFLRPEQVHAISDASERISYKAGDTVYQKGAKTDYLYTILNGQVSLRLPGKSGVSIIIDQLSKGAFFGSCVCFHRDAYALTAQCTEDSELLRIKSATLKELMEKDLILGYYLQAKLSEIYFSRYIETMNKLQAIVMNIPIETD